MQDILVSVAKIQCDIGYGERVRVRIDGVWFYGVIASVNNHFMTVRLDDNRMITDYPMYRITYHEQEK